jgi:hypothetical protein
MPTRDQILVWKQNSVLVSPGDFARVCELALRALELDEIYGHELRRVDLIAILRTPARATAISQVADREYS